jgi:hypothetical protein
VRTTAASRDCGAATTQEISTTGKSFDLRAVRPLR